MKIVVLSSAVLFIITIHPINGRRTNQNKCRRDEKNEVAQQLNRFEKIPEIGKDVEHFSLIAANKLASIRGELEIQVKILQTEFNTVQVKDDIKRALDEADDWNYGWQQTANTVREKLFQKYYHHQWVVLAYKNNEDSSQASFEISGKSSFFYEYGEYAIVAHAAFADQRCSKFAKIFSNGSNLKTLFQNEELFHEVLTEENDLAKCVTNLRELLVKKYKFHADFFIGVIQYQPNYAFSFEPNTTSHHIESLRNPTSLKLSKTVIIGWC